jgi:hypothetical protein
MTTILPEKNKKEIKKTYLSLFFIRLFLALSIVLFITLILQATIFFAIYSEKKASSLLYEKNKKEEIEKMLEKYTAELTELKEMNKKFDIDDGSNLDTVNFLFSLKTKEIVFNSIQITKQIENKKIDIAGNSSNREALIDFVKTLENNESIEGVNFPVESLTKNTDVPFSLSFIIKNEK